VSSPSTLFFFFAIVLNSDSVCCSGCRQSRDSIYHGIVKLRSLYALLGLFDSNRGACNPDKSCEDTNSCSKCRPQIQHSKVFNFFHATKASMKREKGEGRSNRGLLVTCGPILLTPGRCASADDKI